MHTTEHLCTRDPAMRTHWQRENNQQPTLGRWKCNKKMNNRNKHFKLMSVNTKETHTTILMQVHTLTSMCPVSLCVQTDEYGGERSELFAFEGCASQRTEAQGGCGRCC